MSARVSNRWPAVAIIIGGLAMTLLFIPFTLTHGPTSVNEEHVIAGLDMHNWGFAMGVIPNVLIAVGGWLLRGVISGNNRLASGAVVAICVALSLSAFMDLAFRALGPPFSIFVLAPALTVAAWTSQGGKVIRGWLAGLAVCLWIGMALALIPMDVQDGFGGYRITGAVMYGAVGLLWAGLGAACLSRGSSEQASQSR